ncbi:hypothetical protein BDB00DRAFT_829949, partial [Zychaea mexicana]|uniref:uncharacterized protein n=1 Tax=Zychaea mexicana TaxID=64656 RepID=UPI0022FE65F3
MSSVHIGLWPFIVQVSLVQFTNYKLRTFFHINGLLIVLRCIYYQRASVDLLSTCL